MPAKAEKIHDTFRAYLREVNAPIPIYNPDWDMTPNEWLVWSKERTSPKKKARKADKNSKRK